MLKIGGTHVDQIIDSINHKTIEGVYFEMVEKKGIQAVFKHNTTDGEAKLIIKKYLASIPDFDAYFISIQFC